MGDPYLFLKLLHIVVAVVALGTSAGLGIVLELYARDPAHGSFVLRIVERMTLLVVFPGYVLMLATGLWMAHLAWPFTAHWIQLALGLWVLGLGSLASSFMALRKQRSESILSRVSGGLFGLIVVAILSLMVFKP